MKQGWLALVALVAGAGSALGVGCSSESKLNVVVEEGANAPHVNLPTVPTLPPPPPSKTADGAYTVYGVRHDAARNRDLWQKQQRVHGWIVGLYVPRTPDGRVCAERDRCMEERPHIYIADARDERDATRKMMITGYANFQYEIDTARTAALRGRPNTPAQNALAQQGLTHAIPTDLLEGAEVTVTGNFTRSAANGQRDSAGLLEYASHTTNTPAPPPPDPRRR
ncbi:MAG: hypothetical protein HY909_06640 [Deltaproteobacteria bacterium]|nr:hypothetical protein [Deltaproteobacteria bacterium]